MSRMFKRSSVALVFLAVFGLLGLAVFEIIDHGAPEERAERYYENSVKLVEQQDYAKAAIELRNALRLKSNMLPAWRSLAQIEERAQHWDGVIQSLQSIINLDPNDIEARIKLAKLLVVGGRARKALEVINTGKAADRQGAEILGLKAAILYKLDNKSEAVQQARAALSIDAGNPDALVVLATDRMESDDVKGALLVLESEAALKSTDLGIQLLKLKIFERLGDSRRFEKQLQNLIVLFPDDIAFRKQLVKFYTDQHREDDAEKETRAMVKAQPTNSEAELDLVRYLFATKGPAVARQELVARINAGGDVFPYQIALAEFDIAQGNFGGAEQLVESLVKSSETQHALTAKIKLAEIYLKQNKIDAAEPLVSEILRNDSRNTNALKVRASIGIIRGQLESAITDLQQALSDQPRSADLMLLLATAFERSGSIARAEKQYADAVRVANFDPGVGINYVSFLLRRGNLERAEQFLTELSARRPKNLDVLSLLAQIELKRHKWANAQAIAELIRGAGDTHGLADQVLGAALIGQHKYDEGITVLQGAVDASPSAAQPMISLVTALLRAQKTDRAVAVLKSVLETDPNNADAHVLMGSIELGEGAPEQALASFKMATEKQPQNVVGYQALAKLYVGEKRFDEAFNVIRAGLQIRPDSMDLHLALAGTLEQTRQYEAAIAEYEHMLTRNPNSLIVANNLASLLSDHRDDKASLERAQFLAARLRESQVPQFKDTVGWVSYRRGDYINSVSNLENAVMALPKMAVVRYHLGMSYIALRQFAKASEQLNAALSLMPESALEEKIREALKKIPT